MTPGRPFQWCVFLVMMLGVLAYAVAEPLPSLFLVWVPLAGAGWWFSRAGGRALPALVTGVLIAAAVAYGVWRAMSGQLNVSTFSQFLAALLLIKTTERAQPRDYGLMLALSVFLCVGAILTSNALAVATPVILALVLLVLATMLLQIESGRHAMRERHRRLGVTTHERPSRVGWGLVVAGCSGLAMGLAISVVVFVGFPRGLGAGQVGEWSADLLGRRTGFTEVVRLGMGGNITQSQVAVLDVKFRDTSGRVIGGPGQVFYLRGAVLDEYASSSWRRGGGQIEDPLQPEGAAVVSPEAARRVTRLVQTGAYRNAGRSGPVFLSWQPSRVRMTSGTEQLSMTREVYTVRREGSGGMVNFEADIALPRPDPDVEYERFGATFDSEIVRRHALAALAAAQIDPDPTKRSVRDDSRAARAIEAYLSSKFAYTLSAGTPTIGMDPIEWFLDERKAGHCEYFAAAMTAMCRSVGMDARVIAGYVASEWDEAAQHYIVRESNAHAWAEVEIGGGYWMTCDPSPQEELAAVQRGEGTIGSWLGRFLDDLNYAWNRGVVSFDETRRVSLLGPDLASPLAGSPLVRWLMRTLRPDPEETRGTALMRGLMLFFAVLAIGAVMTLAARGLARLLKRRPRERAVVPGARAAEPLRVALLRVLARRGMAKPEWLPLAMHVEQVPLPEADRGLARRVAWASYRARFGRGISEVERGEATEAIRRLERRG